MDYKDDFENRSVFGAPAVLTGAESISLQSDLTQLWTATYGQNLSHLDADLDRCRHFFDPVSRGQTLRQRLAELRPAPADLAIRMKRYGEPLVISAGDDILLVGIEARLMIELLDSHRDRAHLVIPETAAATAEREAMRIYRKWTLGRLRQVIDLRAGTGAEVMQAVAVGLVLALLINRSDVPERAVIQWDSTTPDGKDIDEAIYVGADQFAASITSRNGRSSGEQRLKGGYGLTEARRRLANRLAVVRDAEIGGARIYVPSEYRNEVIDFLARDLARRSTLTEKALGSAFDRLVVEFRASARALAYRSMVFERPADTNDLRSRLLDVFAEARKTNQSLRLRGSGSDETPLFE